MHTKIIIKGILGTLINIYVILNGCKIYLYYSFTLL